MRRFISGIIFLGMLFLFSGCHMMEDVENSSEQTEIDTTIVDTEDNVTSTKDKEISTDDNEYIQTEKIVFNKVLSIVDVATEYDIEGIILNTYSHKDDIGISYVNIEEFIEFLKGGIIDLNVDKADTLHISHTILVDDDIDIVGSDEYTYEIIMDSNTNNISFNDFDIFDILNVGMESEYLTDIIMVDLHVPNQNYDYEIDLNQYDLEIVLYEDDYYIPLYLANLFFSGSYMNVYEMNDEIYLIDNFSNFSDLTNKFESHEYDINHIKNHTTKYLALYFDHFYGLKDFHNVRSYQDELSYFNIDKQTTVDAFYRQIDKFLLRRDDLHTSLVTAGYRNKNYVNSNIYLKDEKINGYIDTYIDCKCYNRNEEITYGIDDNTMVITINSFSLDTKDIIAPIMEESRNYEDIVFDLTCNSGGSLAGVLEVLVYLTDQPIPISYLNPATDTEVIEYYQSATSKYIENNYYLRTSEVTFSAANLFASIFKDMNLGPIMGTNTSGGAAAINYTVLPDGAIIVSSSNMVFMNEGKEIIEGGIDVDLHSHYYSGWWEKIDEFRNVLEDETSILTYDNLTEFLNFNFSIEDDEDFEVEEFVLTFKNYYTDEIVKEYVFTELNYVDSFEKPDNLDNYVVSLQAKYKYKGIYSNELITIGFIDKDLDIVGDYNYTEVSVGESFILNSYGYNDKDVVKLNLTESGLYTIECDSNIIYVEIYDQSYNLLGYFHELQLSEGTYYVAIKNSEGDYEYIIKSLEDDNDGKTIINLDNGENLNHALLDYHSDDEIFEFTLNQDKIITLSFDNYLNYQIFDASGNKFDSDINEYRSFYDYTYLFPKGTYTIRVYKGTGIVNFNASVSDVSSDLYPDDFSKNNEFGKLSIGENQITIDYKNDRDIYYVDILEKGIYVFEGEYMSLYTIDANGHYHDLYMRRIFELEPGRYYFAFSNHNIHQKSILNLEFNHIIDECDEDNHIVINLDEQVTTKVNNSYDRDYFDFTISESGLYTIRFHSDNAHVRYDVLNEDNELVISYKKYTEEINLNEGNYTIVLYQPDMNGYSLRNVTFTISKR